MSRHTVMVKTKTEADEDAVIGYDPPLRTFFLQAFPDEETDEYALWIGTILKQHPRLESILEIRPSNNAVAPLKYVEFRDQARRSRQEWSAAHGWAMSDAAGSATRPIVPRRPRSGAVSPRRPLGRRRQRA